MGYKVGIDTGGTFTDISVINEDTGQVLVTKVPSTPDNPASAVINGINSIIENMGIKGNKINFLIHGTTVATNTLLELKGAKTALITTKGFKDVLQIGRQTRPHLYDFWARKPEPVIPRRLRFEIPERILHTGEIYKNLDIEAVDRIVEKLKAEEVDSVAVCLLHSYINPEHEKKIKKILAEKCPEIFVTISSEVLAEFREYERTSTVAINAYVMPKVNNYVSYLDEKLKEMDIKSDLYIMQSNGGVITSKTAQDASARTVLSGPAGGAMAGRFVCWQTGRDNIITADMGGTSLDVCLLENKTPHYTTEAQIGGYPIKLPMIDINTIGSGGGSIAWIDSGGALRVGPYSAGAVPGPVCYQKGGTEPTVTDANVVLGRINPGYILGGNMEMDLEGARRVIDEKIARTFGLSVEEAAAGILRVVGANMVRGIRVVSVEKGYDPREFSLVAFGGAGPVHATYLARELGMKEVIIPKNPGISSAEGMLTADVKHDYVRTQVTSTINSRPGDIEEKYDEMEKEAKEQLYTEGFGEGEIELLRYVDMRYKGQAFELGIEASQGLIDENEVKKMEEKFHKRHLSLYGYERREEEVEMVNYRLTAFGKLPGLNLVSEEVSAESAKPIGERDVYFDDGFVKTPIYDRDDLKPGQSLAGPCVIEQLDSTTLVWPGEKAYVDAYRNITIQF
ncbi:hydantoinase/oxoprolinase family protein [Natranaerofaba carboxydovora]|uniref:hydantoinase/oxoprolinase family protein n=1 Tax=Natranaerofaba carboxydovora TaxID=2742683 RepID=UPI001F13A571|nr:hydantoinase/oxoprolinase family protein [Natranaerofaba carboxydovora]UMZ74173.1 Acetophenone carboxylase gamma subunit [Natranaerofaba carboxydovora]